MRLFAKIISLILLIFVLVSCSNPPNVKRGEFELPHGVEIVDCKPGKYGGVFVLAGAVEPLTFNELINTENDTSTILSMMNCALVTSDPFTMKTIPMLAESWEISPDSKSYTFKLREGIKYSDGVELTADDVIFTFDAIFAPQLDADGKPVLDKKTGKPLLRYPSRYAGQYTIGGEPIKYEKLGKYKVKFSTKIVYAPFLTDIGFMSILPKHKLFKAYQDGSLNSAWSTQTAINNPEQIVASGPFKLYSYRPGERLVLTANPHYWKADKNKNRLPYIDFLIFKFVADANTATILFATGQCDAAAISATDFPWVKNWAKTYDFKIYERGPSASISFMWFNQNTRKNSEGKSVIPEYKLKWFTNKIFRQAVMKAIDRDGLISGVWFKRAVKLHTIISPANKKWYNDKVFKYDYEPQKALQMLINEGFKLDASGTLFDSENNRVEFNLLVAENSVSSTRTATTIVDNLKTIGIKVNLVFLDFATIISRIDGTYDYDAAMMGFTGGGDPTGGKAIYRSDGFLHVWNPRQETPATLWEKKIDEIIDSQETTLDENLRISKIAQMQEIFAQELPLIFLTTPLSYSGIQKRWQNVKVPPIGSVIWNLEELFTDEMKEDISDD